MKSLLRSRTSSESSPSTSPLLSASSSPWIQLRPLVVVRPPPVPYRRDGLKSPWYRRKRKHALTYIQWRSLLTAEGKLRDGGVKFLKKVRSGGIDPSLREEIWPFLLGVYDLNASNEERNQVRRRNRNEYEKLRKQCKCLSEGSSEGKGMMIRDEVRNIDSPNFSKNCHCPYSCHVCIRDSFPIEKGNTYLSNGNLAVFDEMSVIISCNMEECKDRTASASASWESEFSGSDFSLERHENMEVPPVVKEIDENPRYVTPGCENAHSLNLSMEDFATWQRIIRLDAIRASAEWTTYSTIQAAISEEDALESAVVVGLKDYTNLEPCRIHHASRLVAVLEAYALYDPEIGYCQGMSDLLSPILAVMEEDHDAFWCFIGFMKKARHNFRLDEVGIHRQLGMVSKIIKFKDSHLYRHLEKLQAEDCFFVYRMVVVMFRRELSFEQTLCLWEVMWADQAAIRAGISKPAWGRIRLREAPPPTNDLLLYAIAASVLQRRKLIIERYSSIDEIVRECNSMAGQLDVWKILDDAHSLVVTLHDKI